MEYQVERFGHEKEPLVILDDFASDFVMLRQAALTRQYGVTSPHYPGVRAQADPDYLGERMEVLREVLTDVFDLAQGAALIECAFSIVSTLPGDLKPIQRLPHFDSTDPKRLALLHYFGADEDGGTAFYRHKATRFETVSATRMEAYASVLQAEARDLWLPEAAYHYGSNDQFELIGEVVSKPNRMVIYRGYRLHSGNIPTERALVPDPKTGRLTLNTFLQGR